ncbi:MAG TPA: hypothetical protein ENN79_00555 [Desulfobacteraceae bacterium]|nr:hypothetical protein [Desulfobacteraceae bacterium]
METIALTIDGRKVVCRSDATILSAAEDSGIRIPTLCSHPELKPYGACRICLVEDEESGRLLASCVTPVAEGMSVLTESERVVNHRKNIIRLMMAEHPESCIVCNKGNRCELRKIAAELGIAETGLYRMPNFKPYEEINPFIVRDLSKCILCGKCIRADHELVCTGAIDYSGRGFDSRPATVHERPLEDSICTFCGTCVSMCPTGALSAKCEGFTGTPDSEADSVCGFCGVGCSLALGVSGGRVVEAKPAGIRESVNGSTLCVRGHFAHDYLNSVDRLTEPIVRSAAPENHAGFEPLGWDEAIDRAASTLAGIRREYGPGSIAFIGSSKCTNEENYLFQKIARVLFCTNNVINLGAMNGQALVRYLEEKTMGACRVSPLSGLENAEAILTVHMDPEQWAPVAGYHIKRAARAGTPLVVLNSGASSLDMFAGVFPRPGRYDGQGSGTAAFLDAVTDRLIHLGSVDSGYIEGFTDGYREFRASIRERSVNLPAEAAVEVLKATAALSGRKIAVVLGPDLFEREWGQSIFDAAFNLALATGSIGAGNAGFFVPVAENNLAGSLDMGSAPDLFPGRRQVSGGRARNELEKLWNTELSDTPGLELSGLIKAAEKGSLKGLYIMGENLARVLPDPSRVEKALKKLDFIVVQDIVHNRTVDFAHLVLPGAAFAEKTGSFTNMEGRIQAFFQVVAPPGNALPDWKILALVAKKMGYAEHYDTVDEIRQEIRRVVPLYGNLGSHRREWLRETETGTPFSSGGPRFSFINSRAPAPSRPDDRYPFNASIGPLRWHAGGGTRTRRSARISSCGKYGNVEICPEDISMLGLTGKDRIRVESRFGAIEREYSTGYGLPMGQVFIPQGFQRNDVMNLADLDQLKRRASGWRTCRVKISKI